MKHGRIWYTVWVDDDRTKSDYNIQKKRHCTWNCVCVVKLSWRAKSSCWTVRRPTPMTTWKPRSTQSTWNPTMTWHTWWTRECARSVSLLSPCFVSAVTLVSCTHRMAQDVRVFVLSHPCMKWAFLLAFFFITFIFLHSFLINLKQFLLPFNFPADK